VDIQLAKDALGLGLVLWLMGYALSMVLFAFVPVSLIGWVILPIGTVVALFVAFAKVRGGTFRHFGVVALCWTAIAVIGDYIFIVLLLKPEDGYYKLDVYLYYALTLAIPLFAGWRTVQRSAASGR
jgi:flagellar biosynthesis protein FliQ